MKNYIISLGSLAIIIGLIASCDYVDNAIPPNTTTTTTTGGTTGPTVINRKVFVEDYTGHKCGNCPAAADELKNLEKQYPGKIVPLAIHAGFFAVVNNSYPTEFRTPAGNDYDTQFGISQAGNPNGLTNRTGFGSASFIKAYPSWGGEVAQMITQPAKFQIKIKNTYFSGTNTLDADITVKSLGANNGSYKLVVLLSEDSIIAEQLDYRLPTGSQFVPNYKFDHILRGAINSSWGDAIFASGGLANDSVVKSYKSFALKSNYKPYKCHVIAYVYDAAAASPTYYEVLQVEEEKVK